MTSSWFFLSTINLLICHRKSIGTLISLFHPPLTTRQSVARAMMTHISKPVMWNFERVASGSFAALCIYCPSTWPAVIPAHVSPRSHIVADSQGRGAFRVRLFSGAFAKFLKATIRLVISVHPSVRMKRLGSLWTDFHEI